MAGKVLLESDIHTVAGCPFTIGNKPSPCLRIEWKAGAPPRSSATRLVLLVESSMGLCYSPRARRRASADRRQADHEGDAQ